MTSKNLATLLACALLVTGCGGDESPTDSAAPSPGTARPAAQADTSEYADAVREPEPVAGEMLPYSETDDALIRGYFAFPESMVEPLPAVIVIHEWWGLNDDVKAAAERIAAQGFMTLAVDLYNGESTDSPTRAGELSVELLNAMDAADANLAAAVDFLVDVAGAPAVATLGWSQGGQWSMRGAQMNGDRVVAAVNFYGQPDADPDAINALDTPMLAFFGGRDATIPMTDVRAFRDTALSFGKPVQVVIEPQALHGFANPGDARYNEAFAEKAFARTMAFLREYLGG